MDDCVPRGSRGKERGIPAPLRGKVGDRNVPAPLSLLFDDLVDAKVREFNPRYAKAEGALLGRFRNLHSDIYGNRDFLFSPIVLH